MEIQVLNTMELEVRTVAGMENCFVSLPLVLIHTLERRGGLPEFLVLELRDSSSGEVWTVSWSGASSSSSAIEVPLLLRAPSSLTFISFCTSSC